jgi:hypothetical protein
LALVAAGLALAGCAGTGGLNGALPTAQRPGTSVTLRNPDPDKWVVARLPTNAQQPQQRPNNGQISSVWVCRQLACPGETMVGIGTGPSPTRHPDRTALEKMAKFMPAQARAQDAMMEVASDGEDRITPLSSKVTEVRSYPAILSETKRMSRGKVRYNLRGDLFVGTMMVRVLVMAPDLKSAKQHFDSFVDALDIVDVPPATDPSAAQGVAPVALESPAAPAVQ